MPNIGDIGIEISQEDIIVVIVEDEERGAMS